MSKHYYHTPDSESLWPKSHFFEDENPPDSVEVYEGVRVTGDGHFYCSEYDEVGDSRYSVCGNYCNKYAPRNGRSGRCRHSKNCYEPGEKVTLYNPKRKYWYRDDVTVCVLCGKETHIKERVYNENEKGTSWT